MISNLVVIGWLVVKFLFLVIIIDVWVIFDFNFQVRIFVNEYLVGLKE